MTWWMPSPALHHSFMTHASSACVMRAWIHEWTHKSKNCVRKTNNFRIVWIACTIIKTQMTSLVICLPGSVFFLFFNSIVVIYLLGFYENGQISLDTSFSKHLHIRLVRLRTCSERESERSWVYFCLLPGDSWNALQLCQWLGINDGKQITKVTWMYNRCCYLKSKWRFYSSLAASRERRERKTAPQDCPSGVDGGLMKTEMCCVKESALSCCHKC